MKCQSQEPESSKIVKNNQSSNYLFNHILHKDRIYKKARFSHEINIRQTNAVDVKIRLEKYLDDAFILNVSPVYIIHGKGKGILREKVAYLLDQLSYVDSYRYGESHEGGDGVTVVYFK